MMATAVPASFGQRSCHRLPGESAGRAAVLTKCAGARPAGRWRGRESLGAEPLPPARGPGRRAAASRLMRRDRPVLLSDRVPRPREHGLQVPKNPFMVKTGDSWFHAIPTSACACWSATPPSVFDSIRGSLPGRSRGLDTERQEKTVLTAWCRRPVAGRAAQITILRTY